MLPRPAMSVKTMAWSVLWVQLCTDSGSGINRFVGERCGYCGFCLKRRRNLLGTHFLFSIISTRPERELDVGLVLWDVYLAAGSKLISTLILFCGGVQMAGCESCRCADHV